MTTTMQKTITWADLCEVRIKETQQVMDAYLTTIVWRIVITPKMLWYLTDGDMPGIVITPKMLWYLTDGDMPGIGEGEI